LESRFPEPRKVVVAQSLVEHEKKFTVPLGPLVSMLEFEASTVAVKVTGDPSAEGPGDEVRFVVVESV